VGKRNRNSARHVGGQQKVDGKLGQKGADLCDEGEGKRKEKN